MEKISLMYFRIKYYECGDAYFPKFHHDEIVEATNMKSVVNYVLKNKKDLWGGSYRKADKEAHSYDLVSNAGGVKILKETISKI